MLVNQKIVPRNFIKLYVIYNTSDCSVVYLMFTIISADANTGKIQTF